MLRAATLLLILLVILNLSIFAIRVHSLQQVGYLTTTTGTEGPMIYAVWKVAHHYPLYENAQALLFSNTLYNFLFYRSYAALPGLAGLDGQALMLVARWTTAAFALLGAALTLGMIYSLGAVRNRTDLTWACAAAILLWFGTSPVGWFGLSVRPDLAALFFAGLGLFWFLRFLGNESNLSLLFSSLSFFLAWCFKQSAILTFGATLLVLLAFRRQWKPLLLQFVPFVTGVVTALYVGGPNYRFNILTVPALGMVNAMSPLKLTFKAVVENPLLYLIPMVALAAVLVSDPKSWKNARCPACFQTAEVQLVVLGTIFLTALAGGAVLCFRVGSDRNYFFEAGMIGSVTLLPSVTVLRQRLEPAGKWILAAAIGMGTVVCGIQLGTYMAGAGAHAPLAASLPLSGKTQFGRLRLLSPEEEQDRRSLVVLMSRAPKPILIADDILAQPWYSTDNQFPAFVVDPNVLADMQRKGVTKDDRMATLVQSRSFRSLVLNGDSRTALARQSGYEYVATARGGETVFALRGSEASR